MQNRTKDYKGDAVPLRRCDISPPVTYYFVDFGISTLFKNEDRVRLVQGIDGLDEDVPELNSGDDPFEPTLSLGCIRTR